MHEVDNMSHTLTTSLQKFCAIGKGVGHYTYTHVYTYVIQLLVYDEDNGRPLYPLRFTMIPPRDMVELISPNIVIFCISRKRRTLVPLFFCLTEEMLPRTHCLLPLYTKSYTKKLEFLNALHTFWKYQPLTAQCCRHSGSET